MAIKKIHQLVHTLSYGDAISGEVIALQRTLKELGCESEIYAINTHPAYKGSTQSHKSLRTEENDAEIILHYSLGSPLNELYKNCTQAKRTLIYHNITPAQYFKSINSRVAHDIESGIRDLPELCNISTRLISDSRFNAQDLEALGFSSEILELPLDTVKWNEARNEGIFNLVKQEGGIHFLHVGRIAPNKAIEDIIKVFYFYHQNINKNSRLWLVGIDTDTELYSFGLKRLITELSLDTVISFTGRMADSEIKALYEACNIYLCMSEHEGFCMPVVEAMLHKLPVIAYSAGAVPDTVGDGALLVKDKRHAHIACLAAELLENQGLRERLVTGAQKRVESLSLDHFRKRVSQLFLA